MNRDGAAAPRVGASLTAASPAEPSRDRAEAKKSRDTFTTWLSWLYDCDSAAVPATSGTAAGSVGIALALKPGAVKPLSVSMTSSRVCFKPVGYATLPGSSYANVARQSSRAEVHTSSWQ
jgi:hypothetical protein